MRNHDSVRFATYYKIQRWEAHSLAWKDVQRAHDTVGEAVAAAPRGMRDTDWRIMEITPSGRRPLSA
jgi:hypothetical protein